MSKGYRRGGPQWLVRAGYCMERLEKKLKKELLLPDLAEAVLSANELFSALSEGYDEFYRESRLRGLVGRMPDEPIAPPPDERSQIQRVEGGNVNVTEDGEKDGVEPSPPDSDR